MFEVLRVVEQTDSIRLYDKVLGESAVAGLNRPFSALTILQSKLWMRLSLGRSPSMFGVC